ncbi:MAG TPA: EAL domain-containing protein [Thermoleophilaceae bacterium]
MRRLDRLSLLGKFTLLSLLSFIGLGLVLGSVLEAQIERRGLDAAETATEVAAQTVASSVLKPYDLRRGISDARMQQLDSELKADRGERTVLRAKIFDRRGRVVYSDDRGEIGRVHDREERHTAGFRSALAGRVASDVEREDGRRLLEVYVPLRFDGRLTTGVVELYLPYAPVAAEIRHETRVTYAVLGGGLLVLFGLLFKIVASASRALSSQAKTNHEQARHDALTGLPNRTLLYEHGAVALGRFGQPRVGVLLIDLDRFKEVNDALGHDCGDQLLIEVAERMRREVRGRDMLARLGGDEFAVMLVETTGADGARAVARRLLRGLERPFNVRGFAVQLDASIGIALHPEHGADVTELIQRADVAMYEAKRKHTGAEFYDAESDPHTPARLTLLGELRRAIDEDELLLHYQPQISLGSGAVTGAEALVRWQHPERGLLQPGEFVPLAERTAVIRALTLWVLDKALCQCQQWLAAGLDLSVAVNLAGPNVSDGSMPGAIAELLEQWRVPPGRLELEISESTVMADPRRAEEVLGRLDAMGIRLSLDDFGTGHSSLGYLRRLPLDRVKIDRSFVMNMDESENDATIVRSTIDLARNLGLETVAEGVETASAEGALTQLGCPAAQGFFIGRPMPTDAFAHWLAERGVTSSVSARA